MSTNKHPDFAIRSKGLTKIYQSGKKDVLALSELNLDIKRGIVFGLLGPNGAGKSTFINILAGLVNKTSGKAEIWGHDLDEDPLIARSFIGVVPQEMNYDPFLTPIENLDIQAGMYGVPKKERKGPEILKALGLEDKAKSPTRSLSGGMIRRLMVAKALVHNPPIVVLDEPTAGVDVELRQQLWAYVRELNKKGVTIVLTTHYLEEAEELCDEIAIINHGKLIRHEEKANLLKIVDHKDVLVTFHEKIKTIPKCLKFFDLDQKNENQILIHYHQGKMGFDQILNAVQSSNLTIKDISTQESDLEDVFMQLVKDKKAS